ncbi:hypothetical protein MUU77_04730 [Pseudoxanthomonas sp. F37]|nr:MULTISPECIES: hypothetical protein [Pseudoxanthomonas]UOV04598.1 hypothetical protein MUU75_16060 [Pseudoxanthomonas mexicana]UOV09605.1 hypothetical protein MUU77_04730 [Pseudoxanthomonas sp. F37]
MTAASNLRFRPRFDRDAGMPEPLIWIRKNDITSLPPNVDDGWTRLLA